MKQHNLFCQRNKSVISCREKRCLQFLWKLLTQKLTEKIEKQFTSWCRSTEVNAENDCCCWLYATTNSTAVIIIIIEKTTAGLYLLYYISQLLDFHWSVIKQGFFLGHWMIKKEKNNNVFRQFWYHKLHFIFAPLNIRCLCKNRIFKAILKKVKQCDNHPLEVCFPQEKIDLTYDLRRKGCHLGPR